ncbi:alpha/beta fold hydrolase [Paenibacillus sp. NPDC057967]|uniref:alpha/beta fold hydrolase n=1 Tax=Paenibacillus sp. NPDC057967 TaxID=3346293 RepID=UPI0036DCC946
MKTVFLTGGSGFIGRHVLAQLIKAGHQVYALVRSKPKLLETMRSLGLDDFSSITPLQGDLTKPALGLSCEDQEQLRRVDVIIHAGGPMDIVLQAEEAQKVFRYAAAEMIYLASTIQEAGALKHFIHVVGFKSPHSEQHDHLNLHEDHRHKAPPYEQMKFEADLLIRQKLGQLGVPLSVINPSVVIGDSVTGITEQVGGLGILVNSVRRGLMALAPGGKTYWLPLVHVDHVAACIAALAQEEHPVNNTYFLLDQKMGSPDMMELTRLIALESGARGPLGAMPYRWIKGLLNLGIDKWLKMPRESMDFIVNSEFPLAAKLDLEAKHDLQLSVVPSTLPFVVADLDFRISHGNMQLPHPFRFSRRANLATIEKEGRGAPIILLHGAFSSAYLLLPLAQHLANTCENPIYLVDLPGFGRSPLRHNTTRLEGLEHAVRELLMSIDSPVILAGHSLGGYLAAKMLDHMQERIQLALLLQPVLQPLSSKYKSGFWTRSLLPFTSKAALKGMMLKEQSFAREQEIPGEYMNYIYDDLKSVRVRTSTAEVMSALAKPESFNFSPSSWDDHRLSILWGSHERSFHIPELYGRFPVARLPYAHQFPISHPAETARWIRERME